MKDNELKKRIESVGELQDLVNKLDPTARIISLGQSYSDMGAIAGYFNYIAYDPATHSYLLAHSEPNGVDHELNDMEEGDLCDIAEEFFGEGLEMPDDLIGEIITDALNKRKDKE